MTICCQRMKAVFVFAAAGAFLFSLAHSLSMEATFSRRLPFSRLGKSHESYESFRKAVPHRSSTKCKEYTLIVVTETSNKDDTNGRILLGMKNRGFGKGMYNSFGGKFDHPTETVEACACRELMEETNICVRKQDMKQHKVGIQRFSFDDDQTEMIVHLFHLPFQKGDERLDNIMACDEITPEWFDDWNKVPLDNMFADDSLWLTALLSSPPNSSIKINGWYHFKPNCQETNTILHYYMDAKQLRKETFSLEKRLFHALHDNKIHSPSIKEFKESFAFMKTVKNHFHKAKPKWDVIIDVAGGHGALAALFLITTTATRAVVVDPAQVGNQSVNRAWGSFWKDAPKRLEYRSECLRTGLPAELNKALRTTTSHKILVVACHACQHLSEEILDIACQFGVSSAVMPCCQKDLSRGSSWKSTSKNLGIRLDHVMDLLLAGKHMVHPSYEVRMKCLDPNITPQNRIILCRALSENDVAQQEHEARRNRAHAKLETAYRRAHNLSSIRQAGGVFNDLFNLSTLSSCSLGYMALGFALGIGASKLFQRR